MVGKPHPDLGHVVTAHLVAKPGTARPSDDEMRAHTRAELAGFKVPEEWTWLDELPRTPSGKVLRRRL